MNLHGESIIGSRFFCGGITVGLCLLLAAAVSCNRLGISSTSDEERDPSCRKAKKLQDAQDYEGAVSWYRKALRDNPDLAGAHLSLGLLYDDKLGDPIMAIYHYRQYLELRPDSDKQQLVEDFIERARLSLASKLPQSPIVDPSELTRLQTERAALMQENQVLKARVAEWERGGVAAGTATSRPPPPPVVRPPDTSPGAIVVARPPEPPPVGAPAKTHIVQKGDTLYSLAHRYYGNRSAWEKIYQANRGILPDKDQLKIGQELVIP